MLDSGDQEPSTVLTTQVDEYEDEMLRKAIAMSLEGDPPRIKKEDESEEEMLAKAMAMSLEEHPSIKEEEEEMLARVLALSMA